MSFQKDLDTLDIIYYYDRADQVRSTYFCQVSGLVCEIIIWEVTFFFFHCRKSKKECIL